MAHPTGQRPPVVNALGDDVFALEAVTIRIVAPPK